jgi:tRNA modification GTPase
MTEHNDTICAISTPPGVGGIAVIRVSGPEAIATVDSVWKGKRLVGAPSHTAHLGTIIDTDGTPLDQAVATIFIGPRSYTGDDTVELSVHGSKYIQQRLLSLLITRGCRLAEPGEYTRRAYSSGNIDLTQAEAIADLIASDSRASHRIAMNQMRGAFSRSLKELREQLLDLSALLELELDFSEEDVTFASRRSTAEPQSKTASPLRLSAQPMPENPRCSTPLSATTAPLSATSTAPRATSLKTPFNSAITLSV